MINNNLIEKNVFLDNILEQEAVEYHNKRLLLQQVILSLMLK